jgi:hypothetical protein
MCATRIWAATLLLPAFASATNLTDCRIAADADVLGLGVRLGLYLQLLSNTLVGIPRPNEATESLIPTSFFLTGFVVAVIYSVVRGDYPPSAEINCTYYPILVLGIAHTWMFKKSLSRWWGALLHILYVATSGLNVWFWFKAVGMISPAQCMEPRVFFFANFSAVGKIRVFFRIASVASCVIPLVVEVIFLKNFVKAAIAKRRQELPISTTNVPVETTEPGQRGTVGSDRDISFTDILRDAKNSGAIIATGGILYLAFFVIAVELQIAWNHLDGVDSIQTTGQIIPLVIGGFSFIRSGYMLVLPGSAVAKGIWRMLKFSTSKLGEFCVGLAVCCMLPFVVIFVSVEGVGEFVSGTEAE